MLRNGPWETAVWGSGLEMMTFSYLLLGCLPVLEKQTDRQTVGVQATKSQVTWGRAREKERAGMRLQAVLWGAAFSEAH